MTEYVSEKYRAVVQDDGLLKVFPLAPRQIQIQHYVQGKVTLEWITAENAVTASDKRLLMNLNRAPLFAATYAGKSEWHVDTDCGAQRWIGMRSSRQLSDALSNCEFDADTKKSLMAECRKHKWDFVPRQG